MAFPTIPTSAASRIISTTSANNSSTRVSPDLSTLTKNSGDRLIAILATYESTTNTNIFSGWPAGWTEIKDDGAASGIQLGIAEKISDGTETGTFNITQAGTISAGHGSAFIIMSIPGAHASTASEVGTVARGTTASADPAALDPAGWGTEDTLWIVINASGETSTTGSFTGIATAPSNYTDLFTSAISIDAVGGIQAGAAFRQLNASSENPSTFGIDTSNTRNAAVIMAVRPAAAAQSVTLGIATQAGSAQALKLPKLVTATTTVTAQTLSVVKTIRKTVGVATTLATAQTLSVAKLKTIGPATTLATAQTLSITHAIIKTIGVASLVNTAQALTVTKPIFKSIGVATVQMQAPPVGVPNQESITFPSQPNSSRPLDLDKHVTLGIATTNNSGLLRTPGQAFPIVEATSESATTTTANAQIVNLPAGIVSGDLLLVLMNIGSTAGTLNALAGWTELLDENVGGGLKILYRRADGSEGATITLTASNATRSASIVYRISGAKDQAPEIGTTASGTSTTPDPPSLTPTGGAKPYLWIAMAGLQGEEDDDDTWSDAAPANYTPSPPLQKTAGVAGTDLGGIIATASRSLNAASENPGTFTIDVSNGWRTQTIAIYPMLTLGIATTGNIAQPFSVPQAKTISAAVSMDAALTEITPAQVPNVHLWLDANQITGLNHNDLVTTWEDRGPNNEDFGQSSAGVKPTYQTNVQNGKPGVLFGGEASPKRLTTVGLGTAFSSNNWSAIITQRCDLNNTDTFGTVLAEDGNFGIYVNVDNWEYFNGSGIESGTDMVDDATETWTITDFGSGGFQMWLNGVRENTLSGSRTAGVWTPNTIGNDPFNDEYGGYIFEIVAIDGTISPSQRAIVENYQGLKWGHFGTQAVQASKSVSIGPAITTNTARPLSHEHNVVSISEANTLNTARPLTFVQDTLHILVLVR